MREDGKIIMYWQSKYRKDGDAVTVEEFKNNGKFLTTSINDYSVKHKSTRTDVSSEDYEISGSNIITSHKWGKNNGEETKSILSIVQIDSQNLIYNFNSMGQTDVWYFSKFK